MRQLFLSILLSLSVSLPCWAGASQDFGGSTSNISYGNVIDAGTAITVFAWFQQDNLTSRHEIISKEIGTGAGYELSLLTSGKVEFGCFKDGSFAAETFISSSNTASTTAWNWAAGRFDDGGNTIAVWLNGTKTSQTDNSTCTNSSNNLVVGMSNSGEAGRFFDGRIAYVAIWQGTVLTDAEIATVGAGSFPCNTLSNVIDLCAPLWSDGQDLVSNLARTDTGLTTFADGPPVFVASPSAWRHWFDRVLDWLVPSVFADDLVVCNPSATVPNQVSAYQRSDDPIKSGATTNPNALIWSLPPSPVRPWDGVAPPGSSTYWKCVDTDADTVLDDVVEMSQAEKDVIDAPVLAEAARQQTFTNEQTSNDLCTATLTEITERINTFRDSVNADIAAAATVAQIKTVMTTMNNTYAGAFRKVARCVRARSR